MSKLALIVATAGTTGLLTPGTPGTGREASAQTLTTLHTFSGPDRRASQARLIFDATGALHAATSQGRAYGHWAVPIPWDHLMPDTGFEHSVLLHSEQPWRRRLCIIPICPRN